MRAKYAASWGGSRIPVSSPAAIVAIIESGVNGAGCGGSGNRNGNVRSARPPERDPRYVVARTRLPQQPSELPGYGVRRMLSVRFW
ncbi:MAG: hypothetical protein ACRDT4_23005 [Micromonosporaceae bacterium]